MQMLLENFLPARPLQQLLLLLLLFTFLTYNSHAQQKTAKRVECPELQISFSLPPGFTSLDTEEMERLSQKGKKAIKEEFDNDKVLGWQNGCLNLRDSLKRVIIVNHFSVKEAIKQDGSVKKFIDITFDHANEFLIRRCETKLGIKWKKEEVVTESTINIAGYQVRKDAITLIKDNAPLIISRYYFFEKDGRLYLLSFSAGKANDNDEIEKALESAVKM
jgi:hypothetical protein